VAIDSYNDTGPHEDYSTGLLWDNIVTNDELNVRNRGNKGTNHGWTGANNVVWNGRAAGGFQVRNPPGAQNWLVGGIGDVNDRWIPDRNVPLPNDPGIYDAVGEMVTTRSLYYAQLKVRQRHSHAEDREYWAGDIDNYVDDGKADDPYLRPEWAAAVGAKSGRIRSFDDTAGAAPIAFSFDFGLDRGERVVGASLAIGLRRTGADVAGAGLALNNLLDVRSFRDLGWTTLGTSPEARVIDLNGNLKVLQDGLLNLAILGAVAVDWAVLDLKVAPARARGDGMTYVTGPAPGGDDEIAIAFGDSRAVVAGAGPRPGFSNVVIRPAKHVDGDDDEVDLLGRASTDLNKLAVLR
jgi:hypothetical protein